MRHPVDAERLDIDVRFLLANERTLLAWLRTALTLMAGGVALLQFGAGRALTQAAALGLLVLGCVAGLVGYVRYRAAGRAIHAGLLPVPGRGPALMTAGVATLGVVLVAGYVVSRVVDQ